MLRMDALMLEPEHIEETASYRDKVGCTACVCLIVCNRVLCVANAGDSRAVMSRNKVALALSKDHNADSKSELWRFSNLGGATKLEADYLAICVDTHARYWRFSV
mmetsp:Transcript_14601/g.18044  ORF Transcript_14601/g.18044 Transcript_14601/m.18044 type:complete len:105 (-) Transcript_14601:1607-1921(-)